MRVYTASISVITMQTYIGKKYIRHQQGKTIMYYAI